MRVYKSKPFMRFQRREHIGDTALSTAVTAAEAGLIDADLGGGLIKQRVARQSGGKRGGYRTVIAYRVRARAYFLVGFAKSALDNIADDELVELKAQARAFFALSQDQIEALIAMGELTEVNCGGEN